MRRQGKYHLHSPFVYNFYVNTFDNLPTFGWRDELFRRLSSYRKPNNVLIENNYESKKRLDFALHICDEHKAKVLLDLDGDYLKSNTDEVFDFIYINGKIGKTRVKDIFRRVMRHCDEKTTIMYEGIYHGKTNRMIWNSLLDDPMVTLSIDCYSFGMVFMMKRPEKQHFVLKT